MTCSCGMSPSGPWARPPGPPGRCWARPLLAALPLLLAAPFLARGLDALILGEREASGLGIRVEALKWGAVGLVALAVGGAVAATGLIGFIGMVAPHLVRLAGGAGHRWVLPASALLGALLLAAADGLARVAVAPAELPIGLVTALLGAPIFLALLLRAEGPAR
jgi:iron complex transport system permease protein